jgi:Lrp/AsnC family transcriptional regulator, regulator for asnA, asnC and gidA
MEKLSRNILEELQRKGYQKNIDLAVRFGVGERTIRRHINKMKRNGILKIIASPNWIMFGYKGWAKIGIKVEPGYLFEVTNSLLEDNNIPLVALSKGEFDILISVVLRTVEELSNFVNMHLASKIGIKSMETMLYVNPMKFLGYFSKVNSDIPSEQITSIKDNSQKIDETDQKIIDFLGRDALTPIKEISSNLGVSSRTVSNRIKKLYDDGFIITNVSLTPEFVEYESWAVIGLNINHDFSKQDLNILIKNPAIYHASATLGRFNIILVVHFRNMDLLNEFVQVELANLKGVNQVAEFPHSKPLKFHNSVWSNVQPGENSQIALNMS